VIRRACPRALGGTREIALSVATWAAPPATAPQPVLTARGSLLKAWFDRLAAGVFGVVALPLLALIAIAILAAQGRPVLFSQTRVGRDGRPFTMWKFRTMHSDAEALLPALLPRNERDGDLFKLRHDPRVTPLGRWLRRFSLDELPQLWNVLRGDMSLVGPRPPLPAEVERMSEEARCRLRVRPGMTGLCQVSGRADLTWREAVWLDRYYVERWSFVLDVVVLWRTIGVVVRGRGAY
jgi:lipopolysaccharide/colanic/teichoic acid biosynthesis glycosyltransferase